MTYDDILKSEYDEKFDQIRKNACVNSYYKYGPVSVNYGNNLIHAIKSCKKCIEKYESTHNTEYLADAANYLMFEFMYPSYDDGGYEPTDSDGSAGISGMSVNEMIHMSDRELMRFQENNLMHMDLG